jgi:MFS family permease
VRSLERWSLHLGTLLTGLTGLYYGWLRYYGRVQGEFGIEPHPLQGLVQHLHVLAAPLLLFALGMTVRGHLATKLRAGTREGRRTGLGLGFLILPMVAAGYLVQVATAPAWRLAFAWVHGVASLLFLVAYLVHGVRSWLKPRAGVVEPPASAMDWE